KYEKRKTKQARISEQVETLSSKQKSIRGEDVKLAEGLEREFEMMSLKEEKWASPKKMRKKGAAKPENKKRKPTKWQGS
ncbi:hypothetical protein Csa_023898, partial [Cucumis sativus]